MRTSRLGVRLLVGVVSAVVAFGSLTPSAQAATGPVTVTTQPAAVTTIAVGDQLQLTSAATDSTDAAVDVDAWQWRESPSGTFADVPGSAGLGIFTIASVALGDAGAYRAAFPDGSGGRVFSAIATVDVGDPATIGSITGADTVAPGGGVDLVANDVAGTEPLTVTWQSSSSASGPWSAVTNTSNVVGTLSTTAISQPFTTVYYRATASNPFGTDTTAAFAVTTTDWAPLPVASVTVTNPSSGVLRATWPASSAGGAAIAYRVTVLDEFDNPVTSADTTSLTFQASGLPAGSYRVRVVTSTGSTDSEPTFSAYVAVKLLVRTGTVSAGVVRPFVDGYQDSSRLRATSTFAASGAIRVRNSSGTLVRSYALGSGTSWSVVFNGKTAGGTRLPNGTYKIQFVLGGAVYVTRSVVVAATQVGTPSASWSAGTVFPVRDGYGDSSKMTVRTTVPATQKIVITNSRGKAVYTATLSRRTSGTFTWSGRTTSGAIVPAGSYKATITVKAGEGSSRSVARGISVSAKKLTAVAFTGYITAQGAYQGVISGEYDTGLEAGSLGLWSDPYSGSSIYAFGANLPTSSLGKYSNLKLYGCGYSYSDAAAGILLLDKDLNTHGSWSLGNSEGCYGGSVSPTLLSGRSMFWATGNVGENYSWYWINYFKITGTKYVLK